MLPLADKSAIMATALHELLVGEGDGEGGVGGGELGALFEALVGEDAQLYEHCALITDNGCPRQTVHADTPYQTHAPLYAAFIALQDVTEEMGPTMYIPRTFDEKSKGRKSFDKGGGGSESREEMLGTTKSLLATLKKGGCVVGLPSTSFDLLRPPSTSFHFLPLPSTSFYVLPRPSTSFHVLRPTPSPSVFRFLHPIKVCLLLSKCTYSPTITPRRRGNLRHEDLACGHGQQVLAAGALQHHVPQPKGDGKDRAQRLDAARVQGA
jgi:hypothetical protein